jgi:hypothetical protein
MGTFKIMFASMTNVGEHVREKKPSYSDDGNVN